jgi:nucleoid DNA-binding protein
MPKKAVFFGGWWVARARQTVLIMTVPELSVCSCEFPNRLPPLTALAKGISMAKVAPKALTKTQIIANIADKTELTKKDVAGVFDALFSEIESQLKKGSAGQFTIPGLCKIAVKDVEAKPKRKGRNPADGSEIWLAPKPASRRLTIRALKGLKDSV